MKLRTIISSIVLTGLLFLRFCVFEGTGVYYGRNFGNRQITGALELLYLFLTVLCMLAESRLCFGKRSYKQKIVNIVLAFAGLTLVSVFCILLGWPESDFPGLVNIAFVLLDAFLTVCCVGYYLISYVLVAYVFAGKPAEQRDNVN